MPINIPKINYGDIQVDSIIITKNNNNTKYGYQALNSITTGENNTAIGYQTLATNSTASENIAIGSQSLFRSTTGKENTSIGHQSGTFLTEGDANSCLGRRALYTCTTGIGNMAIGRSSIYFNNTGNYNVGVGYNTLLNVLNNNNVGIGASAGRSLTTANNNIFIGYESGYNASQKVDAENSIGIGYQAYTTESNQVVIGNSSITRFDIPCSVNITVEDTNAKYGYQALESLISSGLSNTAIGRGALQNLEDGDYNMALGEFALRFCISNTGNVAMGRTALYNCINNFNIGIGYWAGSEITAGTENVCIGAYTNGAAGITTGDNNVFIGTDAGYNASQKVDAENSIGIGYQVYTTESNQVIIGNSSITEVKFSDGDQATFSADATDAGETMALVNKIKDWMIDNKVMAAS
jgi:hypothetical protein